MVKLKELKGIARNLADSFTSGCNNQYMRGLSACMGLRKKPINKFAFDFLSGKAKPDLLPKETKKVMAHYQKWLQKELKTKEIPMEMIKSIKLDLAIKRSNLGFNYVCNATIKTKTGKEYSGKVFSGYHF